MSRDVPAGWREDTLGNVAQWFSGGTPKTSVPEYWGGEIPWITAKSLRSFYLSDSERRVTDEGLANGTRLVPAGTVLFVVRGMSLKSEFRIGVARRPLAFGQDCKALLATEGVDGYFLANALRGRADEILGLVDEASHGTGRLATGALQSLRILVPPLDEQRRIVQVLRALDDKIDLCRRMNRTLEAMSVSVFEAALPEGNALELDVPAGWDRTPLGEWCDSLGGEVQTGPFGSQLHASDYVAAGIPSVMPKNLKEDRVSVADIARIRLEDAERLDKHRVRVGDIIYSRRGDVERRALVTERESGWLCGTGFLRVRLGGDAGTNLYLYRYLGLPEARSWIVRHAQGATMANLNTSILRAIPVLRPPASELSRICELIRPLFQRRESNFAQISSLDEARRLLIPKLIHGQIRVPKTGVVIEDQA